MSAAFTSRGFKLRGFTPRGRLAFCAPLLALSVFALPVLPAQAQEIRPTTSSSVQSYVEPLRPLTIADCPAGYGLGVQDTAQPQPLTKPPLTAPDAAGSSTGGEALADTSNPRVAAATDDTAQNEAAQKAAAERDAAPRAFVTGCIPMNSLTQP